MLDKGAMDMPIQPGMSEEGMHKINMYNISSRLNLVRVITETEI